MTALALPTKGRAPPGAWRAHIAWLGLASAAILLLFLRDAADIAAIWWTSATFNHCLLIVPILFWLVRLRLPQLRRLVPSAWAPGLLIVGAGAVSWLLGEAAAFASARHLGLVLMLQGAVIAILGKAVARGLAFPLVYAFFLVPVGAEIVPVMQTVTAKIAAFLLGLSAVPAHLEGIFITTPTGYFEVAEACAGVMFLIAMAAFAALVANVGFRSWQRRAAFIAVALIVPVFANGARAWGTIYIAELTSIDFAAGFDHIFYGFIFFAIVVALILGLAWRFFDRGPNEPWFDARELQPEAPKARAAHAIAAATLLLVGLAPAWSIAIAVSGTQAVPTAITMPQVPGWERVPASPSIPWRPNYAGADALAVAHYRDARGRIVDLAIAVFANQSEGRELVGFGQGAVTPEGRWAWTEDAAPPPDGRAERIASRGVARDVLSFYRVGHVLTGSRLGVKLEMMKTRLLGGPQRAVALLVSAQAPAAQTSARPAIDDFLRALGPIAPLADRSAGLE
jgi:exosortase A